MGLFGSSLSKEMKEFHKKIAAEDSMTFKLQLLIRRIKALADHSITNKIPAIKLSKYMDSLLEKSLKIGKYMREFSINIEKSHPNYITKEEDKIINLIESEINGLHSLISGTSLSREFYYDKEHIAYIDGVINKIERNLEILKSVERKIKAMRY